VAYHVVAADTQLYLVASTIDLDDATRERAQAVKLESEIGTLHVWSYPNDPHLPALAQVCDPAQLQRLLTEHYGAPVALGALTMVVYRPLRRAVVRVELVVNGASHTVFIKVVRPAKSGDVLARHALMGDALAPQCTELGGGALLLESAPGRSLALALVDTATTGDHRNLPSPSELVRVLHKLPEAATRLPLRASIPSRVRRYAQAAVDNGLDATRVQAVVDDVEAVLATSDPGMVVTTHGDFNVANIYVVGEPGKVRVGALIDFDTLGPGHRVDDMACLVAHLAVLPTLNPDNFARVPTYVESVIAQFSLETDPSGLLARTAAVVLSLAAGRAEPMRADQWLVVAESFSLRATMPMRGVS
jgi:aminoglycoside phosphotransferase